MRQLLPTRARLGLERLERLVADVSTALRTAKRPQSTEKPYRDSRGESGVVAAEVPNITEDEVDTPAPTERQPSRVVFEHLDEAILVGPDQTILEAGREAGLDLAFSCTVGGCAACALKIVEGEVVYDQPTCLTEDELESGMCLACVGHPAGELVLTENF